MKLEAPSAGPQGGRRHSFLLDGKGWKGALGVLRAECHPYLNPSPGHMYCVAIEERLHFVISTIARDLAFSCTYEERFRAFGSK